ncbi:hypothetical protein F511_08176 [Dorcoceras hygrometricum]|uniref:Uncharacterized protein n=1 Tax=Dorcoceras hygrometricum TaxID=472368 RepID=A0A2Z7DHV4_9LAMI|nr:hypothetical protein F511_08176 [Dorcoceras hygrometricum]
MGGRRSSSSSSSGDEDGDAEWRAAIDSAAAVDIYSKPKSSSVLPSFDRPDTFEDEERGICKPRKLNHYQLKAQKLLSDILDNSLEVVAFTTHDTLDKTSTPSDGGVRLFKHAPPGIVFDHIGDESSDNEFCHRFISLFCDQLSFMDPKKKPKILPGEELKEKSKKFKKQLQSAVVNGADIAIASRIACQKSLAKLEAREAAAKAAAKREEERVAGLKRIRGERWLPSVTRDMKANPQKGDSLL